MPKFAELPKFILLDFFRKFDLPEYETDPRAYLHFPTKTSMVSPVWEYFYGIVELVDEEGVTIKLEIPFQPFNRNSEDYYDGSNYFYLDRYVSAETAATSAISIPNESNLYVLRRKGGVVQEYLTSLAELGSSSFVNTIPMNYFYNYNKPLLYLGKIYHKSGTKYMLDYWGFDRYAITCLPEHNQTPKIKEFFQIAFDQVYNAAYNQARTIKTLLDPREVNLDYITFIAKIFNIEFDKGFYASLFKDRFSSFTRDKERRFREVVDNIINYLKRKGTYSSLYALFKALFNPTDNKLHVYERWHGEEVFDYEHSYDLEPHFIDYNYLSFYGTTLSGCASADYYTTLTAKGIPTTLNNCYIHRETSRSNKWFIYHTLDSQTPFVQVYDVSLKQIIPKEVFCLSPFFTIIEFWDNVVGYALLVKPDAAASVLSPTSSWGFFHNLDTVIPVFQGYEESSYYISGTTVSASASFEFDSVMPSGTDRVYINAAVEIEGVRTIALSGDYLHSQWAPSATWIIEHNLDSKALVADFFTSLETSAWIITHGLKTKDLICSPYDLESKTLYLKSMTIVDEDLFKAYFDKAEEGYILIKQAQDAISLPTSSSWLITHTTSAYCPVIQAFDSNYEWIRLDKSVLTLEPRSDMSTIIVSASSPMEAYVHTAIPDYLHTQYGAGTLWRVEHYLGTRNLLVSVYETIHKTTFNLFHKFGTPNVLIQFFNDSGIMESPETLTVSGDYIYAMFPEKFKGYVCIAEADYTKTQFSSGSWFIEHGLDIKVKYDVLAQIQSSTEPREVISQGLIFPLASNEGLYYTNFNDSVPIEGYAQVVRTHFVNRQTELLDTWWTEHYLDTREILVATYTPQLTGSFFPVEHDAGTLATQVYNVYDGRRLRHDKIEQTETFRTEITMDSTPISGWFVCHAPGEAYSQGSSTFWTVNHNLNNQYNIVQAFTNTGVKITVSNITLSDPNTAYVSLSASSAGYAVVVEPDYITSLEVISSNPWTIQHNLDKPGALVQLYDDLDDIIPSTEHSVQIRDDDTIEIYFNTLPVTATAVIKGVYPPIYQITPRETQHYSENWIKTEFDYPFIGYTAIRLADQAFMATHASSGRVEWVDDNILTIHFPTSATGYVALCNADAMSTHMARVSASEFYPLDENTAVVKFEEVKSGMSLIKEVGQLTYSAGLTMSSHFKAEIDINCEPLNSPDILNQDYASMLYKQWVLTKPISKYAHYHILISPFTDFTGEIFRLYQSTSDNIGNIYTFCSVDSSTEVVSGAYVYAQGNNSIYWEISHPLNSENLIIQCYDEDRTSIMPKSIKILDTGNILIEFEIEVSGICYIMHAQAESTFTNTNEASGSWGWTHSLGTSAVITDHHFYLDKESILPSNVQIVSVDRINSVWYVPTLGYVKIRSGDYLHVQSTPAYTWTINHNLAHRGVIVKVYDEAFNEIIPESIKLYKNQNRIVITFSTDLFALPINGYAVVTMAGGLFTPHSLMAAITAGGYMKIGNGSSTDSHDPMSTNDLQSPLETPYLYTPEITEDSSYYYVKGKVVGNREATSMTEFGLFTKDHDLAFYSYVHSGQLYKEEGFDFSFFYIIKKDWV